MARKATKPRYWPSRKGWYVVVNSQSICLAKGPKSDPVVRREAEKRFHEVVLQPPSSHPSQTVDDLFLIYVPRDSGTKRTLQLFQETFGKRKASSLTTREVRSWLDVLATKKGWAEATVWNYCNRILKPFTAARLTNLKGLASGLDCRSRALDSSYLLTADVHQRLLQYAPRSTRPFLTVLDATGARPSELAHLEAFMYDAHLHAFLPRKFKTQKTSKKPRVIFLPPGVETDVILPLLQQRSTGKLFRNKYGKPMVVLHLSNWIGKIKKRYPDLPQGISLYMYRHKFATEFLLNGGSLPVLSQLLGTSVKMLLKHYSHISDLSYAKELRQHLINFSTPRPGS